MPFILFIHAYIVYDNKSIVCVDDLCCFVQIVTYGMCKIAVVLFCNKCLCCSINRLIFLFYNLQAVLMVEDGAQHPLSDVASVRITVHRNYFAPEFLHGGHISKVIPFNEEKGTLIEILNATDRDITVILYDVLAHFSFLSIAILYFIYLEYVL